MRGACKASPRRASRSTGPRKRHEGTCTAKFTDKKTLIVHFFMIRQASSTKVLQAWLSWFSSNLVIITVSCPVIRLLRKALRRLVAAVFSDDFSSFPVHWAGSSQSKGCGGMFSFCFGALLLNLTLIVRFVHDQTGIIHESSSGLVELVLVQPGHHHCFLSSHQASSKGPPKACGCSVF